MGWLFHFPMLLAGWDALRSILTNNSTLYAAIMILTLTRCCIFQKLSWSLVVTCVTVCGAACQGLAGAHMQPTHSKQSRHGSAK